MPICDDVVEEAKRLIQVGEAQGLTLRLLGGLAIYLHSPSAAHRTLARQYPDIDLATLKQNGPAIEPFLVGEGYTPNRTFNTLSGSRRQLYYDQEHNRQVDVFIGSFEMCHKLPLADRLYLEALTVPLAELFLTKMQIVQMNEKDILDVCALVLDHEVGPSDEETINAAYIAHLCGHDWGLYTTLMHSIQKVLTLAEALDLERSQRSLIRERLEKLKHAVEAEPKSLPWKMRARVGERVKWYEEPEEVRRG